MRNALVFDCDHNFLEVMQFVLKEWGLDPVDCVDSFPTALDLMQHSRYSIVVLDCGIGTALEVNPAARDVLDQRADRVLLIYSQIEPNLPYMKLRKPFNLEELERCVY